MRFPLLNPANTGAVESASTAASTVCVVRSSRCLPADLPTVGVYVPNRNSSGSKRASAADHVVCIISRSPPPPIECAIQHGRYVITML